MFGAIQLSRLRASYTLAAGRLWSLIAVLALGIAACESSGGVTRCELPADCDSGVCALGVCLDATCNDGVMNGKETRIDCGGICGACGGANCDGPAGCASGVCEDDKCVFAACVNDPCEHDGACSGDGVRTCACPDNWTGASCEVSNGCHAAPCGSGTCNDDGGGGYTCTCNPGSFDDGTTCTTCSARDNCTAVTCTDADNSRCATCAEGYVSDGVGGCIVTAVCTPNPCGAGTCSESGNGRYACACPAGTFDNQATCVACTARAGCAEVTCTNATASVCSACATGFEMDNGTCKDIDDCADDPCGPGICQDTGVGIYECTCPNGTFNDGTTCVGCSAIANCTAATCTGPGNAQCTACAVGFRLTAGGACEDIDDCADDPCGVGTCTDLGVNDYACACPAGAFDNGTTCLACETIANCAAVTCTSLANETCATCQDGFDTRGANCVDHNDCSPNPCGAGTCADELSGYSCNCPAGQFDNGTRCTTCSPITGCSALTCTTASNSVCGTCASGFESNGAGGCRDKNDCSPNPCGVGGTCTDTGTNAHSCACPGGQFSNGTTCVACDAIANCTTVRCSSADNETCTACASNFTLTGGVCVANATDCKPNPCGTGSCVDTAGPGYDCSCSAGQFDNGTTCAACSPIPGCLGGLTCSAAGNSVCGQCPAHTFGPTCTACGDCDDDNPCTTDSCDARTGCVHTPVSDGPIADANLCDGQSTCTGGVLSTGTPLTCDDHLFCNGVETCVPATGCQAGTAPVVDDGFACTVDSCNEAQDRVDHLPSDTFCRNKVGQFCDGIETCDPLSASAGADGCVAGTVVNCADDGNPCTDDVCDETGDRCGRPKEDNFAIPDGNTCNGTEFCLGGQAQAGTNLGPTAPCGSDTVTLCDAADTCNGSGACVTNHRPDGPADDGNVCNGSESCSGGAVLAGTPMSEGEVCGRSPGQCDGGQVCQANVCVDEGIAASDTPCDGASQGGLCDGDDHCSGSDDTCVDVFADETTACEGTSNDDLCDDDAGDHCSGTSAACIDDLRDAGYACRPAAGECDVAEVCSGSVSTCPTNLFKDAGSACGTATPSDPTCDAADSCNANGTCLPNNVADGTMLTAIEACGGFDGRCTGGGLDCEGDSCAFPFELAVGDIGDGDLTKAGIENDFDHADPAHSCVALTALTPAPGAFPDGLDQVFAFTVPTTASYKITVTPVSDPSDVFWSLYKGSDCSEATCVGFIEESTGESSYDQYALTLTADEQYWLVVDAFVPNERGEYLVTVEPAAVEPCRDGSPDCNAKCEAGEAGSPDCNGICETDDSKAGPDCNCATDLFFSEYIEGTSTNKAIEIANFTGAAVSLAGYEIWFISRGTGTTWSTAAKTALTGTIAAGDVFVACNPSASAALQGNPVVCDVQNGTYTDYNGNDSIGLVKDGVVIDVFGDEADPLGGVWTVGGTTGATAEHTILRKSTIRVGNTNWTTSAASEWTVLAQDVFVNLGGHVMVCGQ